MKILHPKIYVYDDIIEDPKKLAEALEEKATWSDWWVFGKIAEEVGLNANFDTFPTPEEWEKHKQDVLGSMAHSPIVDEILKVKDYFYQATSDYLNQYPLELDNWVHQAPSFNCYVPNPEAAIGPVSMSFHTDWQGEKEDARGDKFRLTCTMYLNDEYEGGEIAFVITDTPEDESTYEVIKYRPKAGDIMVFPSTPPFYHGVLKVTSGKRYIVRTFWLEHFSGTPEWLEGETTYGQEKWLEMEKEREKEWHMTVPKIRDENLKL